MIDALLANSGEILPFILIGFGAQMIDGALGMAYGVISSTLLLAMGVPPSRASASVHAAETFTTGVSAISHILHRNVDWGLFARLLRSLNVPLEEGIDPWPPDGLSPADADTGSDDGAVR